MGLQVMDANFSAEILDAKEPVDMKVGATQPRVQLVEWLEQ